jgi:hypothetical protein
MPSTIYARRHAELKLRYTANRNSKNPTFEPQYNAIFHLLGTKRLSRHNTILCGKWILEMQDAWTAPDQQAKLAELSDRHAKAWARWQRRIEERAAQKAAGSIGRKKMKNQPSILTTAPTVDIWEL